MAKWDHDDLRSKGAAIRVKRYEGDIGRLVSGDDANAQAKVEGRNSRGLAEGYPDNNPKTVQGLKKVSLSKIPATALVELARTMMDGAQKYGPYNWRDKPVSTSIYIDALLRHAHSYHDSREANTRDSRLKHLGAVMACAAILIDAEEQGTLIDDRPVAGKFADMIERYTQREPTADDKAREEIDAVYAALNGERGRTGYDG